MIHFIKGQLDTVAEQQIVVENRGIGYEILVPASVIQKLPRIGNEVKIYTYMHVREDAMQLYGFMTKDEREMFQLLITVNGIGPKGALGILSIMDTGCSSVCYFVGRRQKYLKGTGNRGKDSKQTDS